MRYINLQQSISELASLFYRIYNVIKLKNYGVKIGEKNKIINKCYFTIERGSSVEIGNDFLFISGSGFNPISRNLRGSFYACNGSKIRIGNHVGMSSPSIWIKTGLTIGNNVMIGANCIIIDSNMHSTNYMERRYYESDVPNSVSKAITIGNDVFIGMNCMILKGVFIGNRSIIAAGSVVVNNIPDDVVAGGNPCKIIKRIN